MLELTIDHPPSQVLGRAPLPYQSLIFPTGWVERHMLLAAVLYFHFPEKVPELFVYYAPATIDEQKGKYEG